MAEAAPAEVPSRPIYQDRDFYAPAFEIKLNGTEPSQEVVRDIMEVRYSDSLDKIDTFEITIGNWDAELVDFKYTGPAKKKNQDKDLQRSKLFMPETTVELRMGYLRSGAAKGETKGAPEPLQLMLAGTINKLAPTFPQSGPATLKVSGPNILSKLTTKQETKGYTKTSVKDIAQDVVKRGNLKLDNMKVELQCGASEPIDYILQDNQFDIIFLLQLAHRYGYHLFLKDETKNGKKKQKLEFGPMTNEPVLPYSLEWGKSLIHFQPTLTTANQVSEVTVRCWDVLKKKPIKVTVKRSDLDSRPMQDAGKLKTIEDSMREKKETVVDSPFRSEAEAKDFAKSLMKNIVNKMVTARGSTVGTPDLRAGCRVQIQGLGDIFDGPYTLTSTTHILGEKGYTTEFDARLEVKK